MKYGKVLNQMDSKENGPGWVSEGLKVKWYVSPLMQ